MNRRDYIKNCALLFGYAVSAGAMSDMIISCRNEAKASAAANLGWKPVFLSPNQANTIAEMAETICPKTTTPGAKELGVPQFIDKSLKELFTEEDQKSFLKGVDDVDDRCKSAYGKFFVDCDQKQREAILTKLDAESPKFPPNLWGIVLVEKPEPITFFRKMKNLTLAAYFTSDKIIKEVLVYDPIPGTFIGCMPANNMNNWSEG